MSSTNWDNQTKDDPDTGPGREGVANTYPPSNGGGGGVSNTKSPNLDSDPPSPTITIEDPQEMPEHQIDSILTTEAHTQNDSPAATEPTESSGLADFVDQEKAALGEGECSQLKDSCEPSCESGPLHPLANEIARLAQENEQIRQAQLSWVRNPLTTTTELDSPRDSDTEGSSKADSKSLTDSAVSNQDGSDQLQESSGRALAGDMSHDLGTGEAEVPDDSEMPAFDQLEPSKARIKFGCRYYMTKLDWYRKELAKCRRDLRLNTTPVHPLPIKIPSEIAISRKGLSKEVLKIRSLARHFAPEAMRVVADLMYCGRTEKIRLSAAQEILDRGLGKAVGQAPEIAGLEEEASAEITDVVIDAILDHKK